MFLSREIDVKMCQIYTKIHIDVVELPPIRVQYTGHVALTVSRDQFTALPLVGVLMTSYGLLYISISINNKNKNHKIIIGKKPKLQLGFSGISSFSDWLFIG